MGRLTNLSFGARAVAVVATVAAAGSATGFSLAAATSSNGSGSGNSGAAAGAPSQPVIGSSGLPASPTNDTTAKFSYTDSRPQVSFVCSLDTAAFTSCPSSGISYSGLGNATHSFRVEAQSGKGPTSTPATYTWTVANQPFTISGTFTAPLAPGSPAEPLDLSITNPYSFTMKVMSVSVALDSTSKAGCVVGDNYRVSQYTGAAFTVPANSTKTLGQLGVTPLPKVWMLDLPTNQDVCQGAGVKFIYSGSAQNQ